MTAEAKRARTDFLRNAASLLASAPTPDHRRAWQRGLRSLGRRRISTFGALAKALPELTGATGWAAVHLVALYGRRAAVPVLLPLLVHPDDSLRVTASIKLASLGGIRAQQGCIKVLQSGAPGFARLAAAHALASLKDRDERGSEALIACVRDPSDDVQVRGQCAEGLDADGPYRRRAAGAALLGLADPSPVVRFWCAFALGAMRYRPAIPALGRVAARDRAVCPGWWRVADEARDAIAHIEGRPTFDRYPAQAQPENNRGGRAKG